MPSPRRFLFVAFAFALVAGAGLFAFRDRLPLELHAVAVDPYRTPELQPYARYRDAVVAGDVEALRALVEDTDGLYVQMRAARTLADAAPTAEERVRFARLALELRVDEPLAASETRDAWLAVAQSAEAIGLTDVALEAFERALPLHDAVAGLKRLESDRYRLANTLLQARQFRNALNVLAEGGLAAPSIEAPAHRALGEHALALAAFDRWLALEPDSEPALLGRAWSLWNLERVDEADAAFVRAGGSNAAYGRALVANRRGELERAIALFRESGEPYPLWLASEILERRGLFREAIPVYLQLAGTDSSYAQEAAYRAFVLARRLGDDAGMAEARAALPELSFFALRLGGTAELPRSSELAMVEPAVLARAQALMRVDDPAAALGELLFALRAADSEAEVVTIAEALQAHGEYRQSQRAVMPFIRAGSTDLRTWRAAYPRAFPEYVTASAERHGVAPELVWAVMRQESAFYPTAVSRSGARGLMQFMPATWDWVAELLKEDPADPFEPEASIRYGAYYLRWLTNYFDGDLELAVTSYNRGQGYIRRLFHGDEVARDKDELFRAIDALETRDYLQKVMLNYEIYRALYAAEGPLATAR